MSKKVGNDTDFQTRFKNRTENIGKDGMAGIMKVSDKPIVTNNQIDQIDNWNSLFDAGI